MSRRHTDEEDMGLFEDNALEGAYSRVFVTDSQFSVQEPDVAI